MTPCIYLKSFHLYSIINIVFAGFGGIRVFLNLIMPRLHQMLQPGFEMAEYLQYLNNDYCEARRHLLQCDATYLEACHAKLEWHCKTLNMFILAVTDIAIDGIETLLLTIYAAVRALYNSIEQFLDLEATEVFRSRYVCPTMISHSRGRPQCAISTEEIKFLRNTGMKFKMIAKCLAVSRQTLYRHRQRLNFIEINTVITDNELDAYIHSILNETPNVGEVYVIGSLHSRQVRVPRWRIRERLNAIDPVGKSLRRRSAVQRRIYKVKGPNSLW